MMETEESETPVAEEAPDDADSAADGDAVEDPEKFNIKLWGDRSVIVTESQVPWYMNMLASLVLLIAVIPAPKNVPYGIALAIISMVISIFAIAMSFLAAEAWTKQGIWVAYLLLLWNAAGAAVMTFDDPFKYSGNGFFASWAMFVCGLLVTGVTYDVAKEKASGVSSTMGYGVASLVLLIAIFVAWDDPPASTGKYVYGLIVTLLTLGFAAAIFAMEQKEEKNEKFDKLKFPMALVFACLWIVLIILCTFTKNPVFTYTGNGWVAAWAGTILSVVVAMDFSAS